MTDINNNLLYIVFIIPKSACLRYKKQADFCITRFAPTGRHTYKNAPLRKRPAGRYTFFRKAPYNNYSFSVSSRIFSSCRARISSPRSSCLSFST